MPVPISSTVSPSEIPAASSIRTTRPGMVDEDVGPPETTLRTPPASGTASAMATLSVPGAPSTMASSSWVTQVSSR
ncbi:hypothetical protein [Streptosporangium nondiastaticum]|uniref:hypothetical protein n=1 Tax=Streptosporangium nondiastaticum TaxID=35764 RepID=UPI0031F892DB